ncbi:hypothetical protein C0J52_11736 [Blattella germanica]|nr:hypothetical protein C0J52_11736 [Blattella germanica]
MRQQTSDLELGIISSEGGITTSTDEKEPEQPTPGLEETLEKMDKLRVRPKRPSGAQRKQALKAKLEQKALPGTLPNWDVGNPKAKEPRKRGLRFLGRALNVAVLMDLLLLLLEFPKKAKQSEGLEEGGASTSTKETYREWLTTYKMAVIPENFPTNKL